MGRLAQTFTSALTVIVAIVLVHSITQRLEAAPVDPLSYVNPFMGSKSDGECRPAAKTPFGMICWGMDNSNQESQQYIYGNSSFYGLSLLHNIGWGPRAVSFLPYAGTISTSPGSSPTTYYGRFQSVNETASPGYYKVKNDAGVTSELTVTARAGMGLFSYPKSQPATLIINLGDSPESGDKGIYNNITVDASSKTISGFWGKETYRMYFVVHFSHAFATFGTFRDASVSANSTNSGTPTTRVGAYASFNVASDSVVSVRVGISFVSIANAEANLNAEIPAGTSFAAVKQSARDTWTTYLSKCRIDDPAATTDDLTKFYSMLYFFMFQPTIASDANGQYWGADNAMHTVKSGHQQYSTITTWDQGRGLWPLLSMLFPSIASDAMQSMVDCAQQWGSWPGFVFPFLDKGCSDGFGGKLFVPPPQCYAFGARDFNVTAAKTLLLKEMYRDNNAWYYLPYGYNPIETSGSSISSTVEHTVGDFSTARMALSLDPTDTLARRVLQNSANWFHIFNENAADNGFKGYMWSRNQQYRFSSWVSSTNGTGSSSTGHGCNEATTAHMSYMVPHNLDGLITAMGGKQTFVKRLDFFFSDYGMGGSQYGQDPKGHFMGVGNEPTMQIPWQYNWAGAPHRAQDVVRTITTRFFKNTPDGLPGNNDWGAMNAWYIEMALGLYPEIPGVGGLAISGPMFAQVVITLENGHTITLNGTGVSNVNRYIQSATLNGVPYNSPWINFTELSNTRNDNNIAFTFGSAPSSWGSNPTVNAPPSFGPTPTWVDNSDNTISYSGNWTTASSDVAYYNGGARVSTTAQDSVRCTFNGSAISWMGQLRSDGGIADVYIDGALKATIDCYLSTDVKIAKLFTFSNMKPGSHTMKIVVRSNKNASSAGTAVVMDAIVYIPVDHSVNIESSGTALSNVKSALTVLTSRGQVRIQLPFTAGLSSQKIAARLYDMRGIVVRDIVPVKASSGQQEVQISRHGSTKSALAIGNYICRITVQGVKQDVLITVR